MRHILSAGWMCNGFQPTCTACGLVEVVLFVTHYGGGGICQCPGPKGLPQYMLVYEYLLSVLYQNVL
jgi:hypothetical protein